MRFSIHSKHGAKAKDIGYVSDFTNFMNHYLEDHPEVIEDRRNGFYLYWDRKVDQAAIKQAEKDSVPDDRYGFDYSAWHGPGTGA